MSYLTRSVCYYSTDEPILNTSYKEATRSNVILHSKSTLTNSELGQQDGDKLEKGTWMILVLCFCMHLWFWFITKKPASCYRDLLFGSNFKHLLLILSFRSIALSISNEDPHSSFKDNYTDLKYSVFGHWDTSTKLNVMTYLGSLE